MIVVHGLGTPDEGVLLWGEDSTRCDSPTRGAARRGVTTAAPHPFAADTAALVTVLTAALDAPAAWLGRADTGHSEITLPSQGARPLDSPELVRDTPPPRSRAQLRLSPWLVPTLTIDAGRVGPVLTAVARCQTGVGASLRHLARVAEFAEDLARRGRVLPTITADDTRPGLAHAQWRPVLTGADERWSRALASATPPVARARVPELPVDEWTSTLLGALVDAAVRTIIAVPETGRGRSRGRPSRHVLLWRRWLARLASTDATFTADAAELAELTDAVTDWQRDATAGRVRACFRLVEPDDETPVNDETTGKRAPDNESPDAKEPLWRLGFALQDTDEPSLLVDANQVWRSRGPVRALARLLHAPQETLLAELGRASRLYAPLTDALRTATPTALTLDTAGAHQFLRNGAALLSSAGFGVLLPGWWTRPKTQLGARLHVSSPPASTPSAPGAVTTAAGVGLDAVVDFQWRLALGEHPLAESELAALAELKAPLVRLRGEWVEVDPTRIAAGLAMLGTGRARVADLLRAGATGPDATGPDTARPGLPSGSPHEHPNRLTGGLPVLSVTADGPLADLFSGELEHRLAPIATPDSFIGTLRPYQERGLAWLSFMESLGLGPVLADDMGLGKTATVLALLTTDAPETGPTLLVCPMSLVGNWQREVVKFAPGLRVHVHHGAERARGRSFTDAVDEADLVITTYALVARDHTALARVAWHRVVIDEAQAIKNAATKPAVALRSLPAPRRIAMTGTPVENRLADLWSIMEFTNPGPARHLKHVRSSLRRPPSSGTAMTRWPPNSNG